MEYVHLHLVNGEPVFVDPPTRGPLVNLMVNIGKMYHTLSLWVQQRSKPLFDIPLGTISTPYVMYSK